MRSDGSDYAALKPAWAVVMADSRPEQLSGLDAPVLIVGGQLDQLIAHARRYAACCTDARIVIVPRATHLLPVTHPEVVAELVADLVTRVSTSRDR